MKPDDTLIGDYCNLATGAGLNEEEILQSSVMTELIETHANLRAPLRVAARKLAGQPDAAQALWKASKALVNNKIDVFFSYKKKDEDAAQRIVSALRRRAGNRLRVTFMAEFQETAGGTTWGDQIRRGIKEAHWFILLLPDPSEDWDWCLFETGMFRGVKLSSDRLFCLHHPNIDLPEQISEFQAVPAQQDEVEKFLRRVFLQENPVPGMGPINPYVADEIPAIASEIVDAIHPPTEPSMTIQYNCFVTLRMEPEMWKQVQEPADLEPARIVATDDKGRTASIFGYELMPGTWGELVHDLCTGCTDRRWLDELCAAISQAVAGRIFRPVQATLRSRSNEERILRPVLHASGQGQNGDIETLQVLFVDEVAALDTDRIPLQTHVLATVVRSAFRFRWEVLEPFTEGGVTAHDLPRLTEAIYRIETDARSRGADNMRVLLDLLGDKRQRFAQMLADWFRLHDPDGNGELDIAISQGDVAKVQGMLNALKPINTEFLGIVLKVFWEQQSLPTPANSGGSDATPRVPTPPAVSGEQTATWQ